MIDVKSRNELLAKVLLKHKLANKDTIATYWKHVSRERDIGLVLVENELLRPEIYDRILQYVQNIELQQSPQKPDTKTQTAANENTQKKQAPPTPIKPPRPDGPPKPDLPPRQNFETKATPAQPKIKSQAQPEQQPLETDSSNQKSKNSLPSDFLEETGFGDLNISIPRTPSAQNTLQEILIYARKAKASDVHIIPNSRINLRLSGTMTPVSQSPLSADEIETIVRNGLLHHQLTPFLETGDAEFVYTIEGGGRYRVTLMKTRSGWCLTARIIQMKARQFESIGLPESCKGLTQWAQGLVLVTGPAGCGKTSTLATLVEMINQSRSEHIITIEDPIEVLYSHGKCQINQRQVGLHTLSQGNALRGALRQDPDILVISELRDVESIKLAVSAAETGHLVFGTMNTTNATRTIHRLIDSFPPDEQPVIRSMISESLRGVICQQLIPKANGDGVITASEVLIVTKAVANMIRKNETHQLASAMVTGKSVGMVNMDDSLDKLLKQNQITADEAYQRAFDKKRFPNPNQAESRD